MMSEQGTANLPEDQTVDDVDSAHGKVPDIGRVRSIPMRMTVELGRASVPLEKVMDAKEGSVLELDAKIGEPMDIRVNGKLVGRGDLVVMGEKFGVKIVEITGDHK